LSLTDAIVEQLIRLDHVDLSVYGKRVFDDSAHLGAADIDQDAASLCQERGYPSSLSKRSVSDKQYTDREDIKNSFTESFDGVGMVDEH